MASFSELVGCARPLQLAGMGAISSVELAAAVSNAGGLGMLAGAGIPTGELEETLARLEAATASPFGINYLMPFIDRAAVPIAARRCRVVEFFWGEPDASLIEVVHDGGALASWQVGSTAEARAAIEAGCDLIVAQGIEAGGHVRGTLTLASFLSDLGATSVPIVAAGGIGTATDVAGALDRGASAVRVGTRFVAANESVAHDDYVDALIRSVRDDTVLTADFATDWPDAPARVLRSSLDAARTASDPAATVGDQNWPVARFSTLPPTVHARGNVAAMPHYAGFSVDAVGARMPAAAIVEELLSGI